MAVGTLQETGTQTNGATPTPSPATPPRTDQGQPFTDDQLRAWAEGKPQPATQAQPSTQPPQGQPYSDAELKAWAERGTGLGEVSPALKGPSWWEQLLVGPSARAGHYTSRGRTRPGNASCAGRCAS